ncbi:hypothetical protein O181_004722 [Austropuccinia psidii MF-1]|uniref:Uncharacterized protein n=1 Tax=Austropuccinia psidii MF-1 TaxID=1389203 RepID=A0A9Q3BGT6_9BASI|nr:hypothetical protein [Austropuccinia psidii MF-1]
MFRWKIERKKYRGQYEHHIQRRKRNTNADGLSRWPLDNVTINPAYYPEVFAKVPVNFMEIDSRRNFKLSRWAPGKGTQDTDHIGPEETETHISGISSSELHNEFFNLVNKS